MDRTIFLVSDRTGITIETLAHTLLTQFDAVHHKSISLPFIDTPEKARAARQRIDAIAKADGVPPVIFSSLIDSRLRDEIRACGGIFLDLFEIYLPVMEKELAIRSRQAVGLAHAIDDISRYESRVEAINFTLSHDDGADTRKLKNAEVILLGVSRSGKTPTCLYLALQFGVRAANYPLTEEDFPADGLPPVLERHRRVLFGLSIAPERLQQIRQQRRADSAYASLARCRQEVQWAERLYSAYRIPFLNTTTMSIEEIAAAIMHRTGLRRRPA